MTTKFSVVDTPRQHPAVTSPAWSINQTLKLLHNHIHHSFSKFYIMWIERTYLRCSHTWVLNLLNHMTEHCERSSISVASIFSSVQHLKMWLSVGWWGTECTINSAIKIEWNEGKLQNRAPAEAGCTVLDKQPFINMCSGDCKEINDGTESLFSYFEFKSRRLISWRGLFECWIF